MRVRIVGIVLAATIGVAGCSSPDSSQKVPARLGSEGVISGAPASFINRVWVVAESKQVAPGELRVFLSGGTLVMASPHATTAIGTWRYRDGHLMITEEGREYRVEILELNEPTFRIRIHGPGEAIDIRFKPAEPPPSPDMSLAQPEGWVTLKPEPAGSGPTLPITGTVHHLDLEGGLFVIRNLEGTQYNPLNLPEAFRIDGMAVEAEARRRDDMMSIGMVGPLVELLRIRSRPGGDPAPGH